MRTFLGLPIPPNVDPIWDEIWEEAQGIVTECDLPALPQHPIRRARSDTQTMLETIKVRNTTSKVFLTRVSEGSR